VIELRAPVANDMTGQLRGEVRHVSLPWSFAFDTAVSRRVP
jgi:hypothetical protein